MQEVLAKLERSRFRRKFRLSENDIEYIQRKTVEVMYDHAEGFIRERLREYPRNDGKQTPWKGHPVFIAQHATATCCRGCMAKWHNIPKNVVMDEEQIAYVRDIIMTWMCGQIVEHD